MERQKLFDEVEARLSWLATRIELRASANILNYNIHSEDFFIHFLHIVYGFELKNLNNDEQNVPGLDLVDDSRKIVLQVSSTATKKKIESSLSKNLSKYKGYTFKFVSISKKVSSLVKSKIHNSSGLFYDPESDTLDLSKILMDVKCLDIDKLKSVHSLICQELPFEVDRQKVESNLSTIIEILAKVDWKIKNKNSTQIIPYDIDKKIAFNNLSTARLLIDDYKSFYFKVDQIYTTFDEQGLNKSLSVLNGLRSIYLEEKKNLDTDDVFNLVVRQAMSIIEKSKNYTPIPQEELQMCLEILTVDAFIRCKIFENPEGYLNATAR